MHTQVLNNARKKLPSEPQIWFTAAKLGTQLTCFTGTLVQILAHILAEEANDVSRTYADVW